MKGRQGKMKDKWAIRRKKAVSEVTPIHNPKILFNKIKKLKNKKIKTTKNVCQIYGHWQSRTAKVVENTTNTSIRYTFFLNY